ncbi:class I fructose-bisphosphate aldolase [Oceanobacillus sp. CFH 90083]|uniref:class I fructose-bisphosphate aldolase n=1 Tax=Oceanobacillus sp. CFH 90083 TaxID=2592336 RepID=UPI00128DFBE2|nr:phospho-2-dehydro-3-deoxyheptonate aldolase [Oceanobacillus sp. CFH 90083]
MPKERRLSRIFSKNGKTIILALDAYYFSLKVDGIDKTVKLLPKLAEHGLNAVITTYGMAKMYMNSFVDFGMIIRADISSEIFENNVPRTSQLLSVEDAVKLGADGVMTMTFPGSENEMNSHQIAWNIARESEIWNVPYFCETLPYSYHITLPESNQTKFIAAASRVGTELGADVIKTRLTGTDEDSEIIQSAQKPVLVLGGPETKDILAYFKYVYHCMEAGAKGVAVGRKITLDPNPVGVVAGLNAIIHLEQTPEEALDIYHSIISR